jgi:hypothetical protein
MARVPWCEESVYRAAGIWVERSLREQRSLFTGEHGIWVADACEELERRIGEDRQSIHVHRQAPGPAPGAARQADPAGRRGAVCGTARGDEHGGRNQAGTHSRCSWSPSAAGDAGRPTRRRAGRRRGRRYGAGMSHRHAYLQFILRLAQALASKRIHRCWTTPGSSATSSSRWATRERRWKPMRSCTWSSRTPSSRCSRAPTETP